MMDFDAAVDELLGRGPGRMLPDVERISQLADLMGQPQLAYPTIHVTGTNGKGSTVRMIATLCSAAGLSPGSYTSPHLQTIRERLAVAGRMIGEADFARVYTEVAPLAALVDDGLDHPDDHVTFFEMLTAMAYWWFADKPVDVGVFEVGMGGRWDATNLVRGDVAVLTPIDVDHAELGDTPEATAREKAGIIKDGARVVCARQRPEVQKVIDAAAATHGASVGIVGRDFELLDRRVAVGGQSISVRVGERRIEDLHLPLFGAHQADNALLAVAAFAAFAGGAFDRMEDDVVRQGLAAVTMPGRLEVAQREPTVVLDGAHNPHGARAVAAALEESFAFRNLILVLASLQDKDVDGIVSAYRDVANHVVVTEAPSPRTVALGDMAALASKVWAGTGVIVESAPSVVEALDKAAGVAGEGDGVLVTGSLYTVGAARDLLLPVTDTGDEVVRGPEDEDDEEDEAAFNAALEEMLDRLDDEPDDG